MKGKYYIGIYAKANLHGLKMKRILLATLAATMFITSLTACTTAQGEAPDNSSTPEQSQVVSEAASAEPSSSQIEEVDESITIYYTEEMQALGHTEPVVLEEWPERVVSLSTAPVMTLHNLGLTFVGVPSTSKIDWSDDITDTAEVLQTTADDFSYETVIALEPDFILLTQSADAQVFHDAGIPVYHVLDGPSSTYPNTKTTTQALVDAFGNDSEAAKELMGRFDELEVRIEEFKTEVSAGKTVMVLHNTLPNTRIQTSEGYLGSILHMLGYENVNEGAESYNMPIDMETMIGYDPDYIFIVASALRIENEAEEFQKLMEEAYKENQDYWDSFDALVEGDTFYLSSTYRSSLGISIIDDIHALMDIIEAHVLAE